MTAHKLPSLSPAMLTSLAQSFSSFSTLFVAFALLQYASTYSFGQFSMLQLVLVVGLLLQTALVQAPLLLLQARTVTAQSAIDERHGVLVVGTLLAPLSALFIVPLALWAQWSISETVLAALAIALQARRALQRFYCQNQQHFASVAIVDVRVALSTVLLVGLGMLLEQLTLLWVLAAINVSLLLFRYPVVSFRCLEFGHLQRQQFVRAYAAQGKPALKGALVSELMSNGHSYWIALCLGAQALAPYAAAALVFRPAAVLAQSIVQASRGAITRLVQQPDASSNRQLSTVLQHVKRQLAMAYLSDLAPALLLLLFWPELLWPQGLTKEFLCALAMAAVLTALRLYRQIPILLLQAQDQFDLLYRLQRMPALIGGGAALLAVFYSAATSMALIVCAEAAVAYQLYRQFTPSTVRGN